jgi:phage major head subunit gpT-like protein
MEVRPSSAGRELIFWLLETARIYPEKQGGNKRYDDMAAMYREIVNENSGAALSLRKNEIQDNQMAGEAMRGMPALDYAANWAKQMGGAKAYWPQQQLFKLILAGETDTYGKAYDEKAFFAEDHPINPVTGRGGDYKNLWTDLPLDVAADPEEEVTEADAIAIAAANLNTAVANVMGLTQPNGAPRFLRPRVLLHGPQLQYRVNQLLESRFYNAGENVFTRLGIEPVCSFELANADDPSEWYLGVEPVAGEGAAFVYQDREPYTLTSYTSESQVELNRRKLYEWLFDGRNAAAYGHPYLFHKFKPSGD